MKCLFITLILCASSFKAFTQQQTYDRVSYAMPKGWKAEQQGTARVYSKIDGGSWAQIAIYKSTETKGSINADFDSEWNTIVAKAFNVKDAPEKTTVEEIDGWKVMSGSAVWQHIGSNVATLLTTYSGHGICISILCNATARPYLEDYKKFIGSATLIVPDKQGNVVQQNATVSGSEPHNSELNRYVWRNHQKRTTSNLDYHAYSKQQYEFRTDGTYTFYQESMQPYTPKYYLVNEMGAYTVKGDIITLRPSKSQWSQHQKQKTDPAFKSGNTGFATYQYRMEYTSIYDRLRLVLWPVDGKENQRDGPFNYHNNEPQKAYLYDAEH